MQISFKNDLTITVRAFSQQEYDLVREAIYSAVGNREMAEDYIVRLREVVAEREKKWMLPAMGSRGSTTFTLSGMPEGVMSGNGGTFSPTATATEEASPSHWPRVRDLPENERVAFLKCLVGQTVPYIPGEAEQDFYYPWDYERWKLGMPVVD